MSATSSLSKSVQIRLALADEITSGILQVGQLLDEQKVAERFGTSRTPARKAIHDLAIAGLVEMRPRRRAVVASVTPDQVVNMFEMTAELEAVCVRLATYRMTPIERGRLQQLHGDAVHIVESEDFESYDLYNLAFHEIIYEATRNDYMARHAMELRIRLAPFRRTQLRNHGRLRRSRDEHEGMMNAINRGDGEEAAVLMRAHMLNAASALSKYLSDSQDHGASGQ